MFHIGGRTYEIVQEHRNAWNPEMFRERYSEVLDRYDYIVGDWGYNQLRLKGFFKDQHPKSNKDTSVSGIMDYINEYCNFGCAYFILEKKASKDPRGERTPEPWETDAEMEGAAAAEQLSDLSEPQQDGISLAPHADGQTEKEENSEQPPSRAERHRRAERQFRTERAERNEKPEKNSRQGRSDRQARGEHERGTRGDRGDRAERPERGERPKSGKHSRGRYKPAKQGNQERQNASGGQQGKPNNGAGAASAAGQRATEGARS